ncbi:MAG: SDR family NAD(P)-dependent oxidoreductase [Hyphomicrobiales bacterium]
MSERLKDRLAVITGASRGIGREIARVFAREGAHVLLLARTVGGLEEVDDEIRSSGGSATLVPVDITDFEAIDRLGASIHERWGKLDILIGNAGLLGQLSPLGHIEPKTWEDVMAVNVTANWRLIRSLDPLLHQSDAGRAVFVTSRAATTCRPFWGVYSVSKAALDAMVKTYAGEVESSSVRANLFNPGPVRTAMRAQAMPGEDPATLPAPQDVAEAFIALAEPACEANGMVYDFPSGQFVER